ncbi:MAG: XkdQ/YqbQ family protein [Oscillospiraceae bacterium]
MAATIDITKLKYKLILVTATGKQLDITKVSEDLGWEEGEAELAMRISFTTHNAKHNGERLSSIAKPGSIVAIIADWGTSSEEVARGTIQEWEPGLEGSLTDTFGVLAYDELFNLQQSQDNRYYSAGTGTKAAITGIFKDWGVPIEKYDGPDVAHAKTLYKNEFLSDICIQLLEDAEKKGAPKCVIRSNRGKVSVIPKGSNKTIYHFDEDSNATLTRDKISTVDLITRVKVVGKEDSEGRQPVEAVLDGLTQYGIRQSIQNRSEDDTLAAAKSAAQDTLDEFGKPTRTIVLEAPDVPTIRKGDKVHVKAGTLNGYYITKSVRHDAANRSMSMEIEPEEAANTKPQTGSTTGSSTFNKGDSVILNGAVYVDSYGNGKGRTFSNRKCKITIKVDTSRPCPYHVDGIGWVKPSTITKA